jgi:hypothetical protein
MPRQRVLSEEEKYEIRKQRCAELAKSHPGTKFFVYVADTTDEEGEPIVTFMREDDVDDPLRRE